MQINTDSTYHMEYRRQHVYFVTELEAVTSGLDHTSLKFYPEREKNAYKIDILSLTRTAQTATPWGQWLEGYAHRWLVIFLTFSDFHIFSM